MTARPDHLAEQIQDLLDDRLTADARARAEAHLEACTECRGELEALRFAKAAVRTVPRAPLPPEAAASVREVLDVEDRSPQPIPAPPRAFPWRPVLALAAMVAVVAGAAALWRWRDAHSLPARVARDFVDYEAGRVPLEKRTGDPRELEKFFAGTPLGFEMHVFDLAMMRFKVVGGHFHDLGGRPTSFFVYEGPGGKTLICEMYLGRLEELPAGYTPRVHNGIPFRVYERDGMTMAFWQEGRVICVLAARGDPEEVIQLAFAKAIRVARNEHGRVG